MSKTTLNYSLNSPKKPGDNRYVVADNDVQNVQSGLELPFVSRYLDNTITLVFLYTTSLILFSRGICNRQELFKVNDISRHKRKSKKTYEQRRVYNTYNHLTKDNHC